MTSIFHEFVYDKIMKLLYTLFNIWRSLVVKRLYCVWLVNKKNSSKKHVTLIFRKLVYDKVMKQHILMKETFGRFVYRLTKISLKPQVLWMVS